MNTKRTHRLFDEDSKAYKFSAIVLSCEEQDGKYTVVLDGTLFFPEEGGQTSDTGTLGGACVSYVYETQGIIYHECDKPLNVENMLLRTTTLPSDYKNHTITVNLTLDTGEVIAYTKKL